MRLLTLLLSVLALALSRWRSSRRPVTPRPGPRPRPVPPLPEPPQRELRLPVASPGYRDGLRPVPEPARVRPCWIAEELRRERCALQAGVPWLAAQYPNPAQHPDPVPDPVPDPAPESPPDPELPRRVPGEHAPPPMDPRLAVPAAAPAASPTPPSDETLQQVLQGLQHLQDLDTGTGRAGENTDPPTWPLAVIR